MLNASADTTASSRIAPRQPQVRDAKPPQDDFSSLVDSNAASSSDEPRDRAPRESDQTSQTSTSQTSASQKARGSREQDDRTNPSTDRTSSSDDTSAPEPASAGKTDAPADAPKKEPKKADGEKTDTLATDQPAKPAVDAITLDLTTVTPDTGKAPDAVVAAPVAIVPPPSVPAVVPTAQKPLAIAATGIAVAKAATAKTSDPVTTPDTSDPASPDVITSSNTAETPTTDTSVKAATGGAVDTVPTKVETRLPTPSDAKPASTDAPAAATAKAAAKPSAQATDAKSKDVVVTADAPPAPALHAQPHDHRATASTPSPDLTPADAQLIAPQQAAHTTAPASATAQLTATVATTVPVPLNGLAVELAARAQSGATRFEIRLDPAELGRIDVRIDIDKQGQVTSHLTVEKPETLAMLRQDSPQLQRALTDAGLKTSDSGLQFKLGDQSQPRQQADSGERQAQRFIIRDDENAAPAATVRGYGRMRAASSGVDISV